MNIEAVIKELNALKKRVAKLENNNVHNTNNVSKQKRKNMTLYWGTSFHIHKTSNDIIDNHPIIKELLGKNPNLVKQTKNLHVTLLFVGKKENEKEEQFTKLEGKECLITVSGVGYSENAMALKVDSVKCDNLQVPFFGKHMHITLALKNGTKPVDSVKTLLGEGTVKLFDKPIVLKGHIKRFRY